MITAFLKYLFLLTVVLYLPVSCGHTGDTSAAETLLQQEIVFGKPFFDYDAIDHYVNDINEHTSPELFDNLNTSPDDSIRTGVIIGKTPLNMDDLTFIDKLETFGYKKSALAPALFKTIDSLFIEKTDMQSAANACIYIYRDILIFKKKGKVIGTAKICFACGDHQIKGTSANTELFGQNGDYEVLRNVLNR